MPPTISGIFLTPSDRCKIKWFNFSTLFRFFLWSISCYLGRSLIFHRLNNWRRRWSIFLAPYENTFCSSATFMVSFCPQLLFLWLCFWMQSRNLCKSQVFFNHFQDWILNIAKWLLNATLASDITSPLQYACTMLSSHQFHSFGFGVFTVVYSWARLL